MAQKIIIVVTLFVPSLYFGRVGSTTVFIQVVEWNGFDGASEGRERCRKTRTTLTLNARNILI